jgi:hypothetical protein
MVLCVAIYSVWGIRMNSVIVHDHPESHAGHHLEMLHASDPHHDDHENHHDGDEGEHHHHLSISSGVAIASVTPSSHSFSQHVTKLSPTLLDEVCPSGPVFELIKPPQVG